MGKVQIQVKTLAFGFVWNSTCFASGAWLTGSNLAMSDLESLVIEVQHWKSNIDSVATFYQASLLHFDELEKIAGIENQTTFCFRGYFEVQFVEHLKKLSKSSLAQLPFMQQHWENIVDNESDTSKTEKVSALGLSVNFHQRLQRSRVNCWTIMFSASSISVFPKILIRVYHQFFPYLIELHSCFEKYIVKVVDDDNFQLLFTVTSHSISNSQSTLFWASWICLKQITYFNLELFFLIQRFLNNSRFSTAMMHLTSNPYTIQYIFLFIAHFGLD